jgi:hypothetical protein
VQGDGCFLCSNRIEMLPFRHRFPPGRCQFWRAPIPLPGQ